MIDVSNDGHSSNIVLFSHDFSDLINSEVNHFDIKRIYIII